MSEISSNQFTYEPASWKTRLFVLLLAGVFVWLHSGPLDQTHFWTEEIRVADAARAGSIVHAYKYSVTNNPHGLVYNLAAAAAVKIAGPFEPVMRFPALIFGALCLPIFFVLLRRFVPNGLALIALIFLFISPPFIFMSGNAGGQSLFILLSLLILLAMLRPCVKSGALKTAALIILFTVAFYTDIKLLAVILFGGIIDYCDASGRRGDSDSDAVISIAKKYLPPLIIAAALYAPVFILRLNRPELFSQATVDAVRVDLSLLKRIAVAYVVGAGGFTRFNAALAVAGLFPVLYGALKLFRASKAKFTHKLLWIILFALGVFALIPGLREGAPLISVDTFVPLIPIVQILIAAGAYYYFTSTFRRDLASVYSIGLFIRMAVTGFIMAGAFLAFGFYTVKNISDVHFLERQNWREAYKRIAEEARPGDTLIIQEADENAMEYYLGKSETERLNIIKVKRLSRIEGILKRSPRTWILLREQPTFGAETQNDVDKIMRIDMNANQYGGFLGDLRLAFIDGYLVAKQTSFRYMQIGHIINRPKSGIINIECIAGSAACNFKMYIPERDIYKIYIYHRMTAAENLDFSICGENTRSPAGAPNVFISKELKPGPCEIELKADFAKQPFAGIGVEKTKTFELIPLMLNRKE